MWESSRNQTNGFKQDLSSVPQDPRSEWSHRRWSDRFPGPTNLPHRIAAITLVMCFAYPCIQLHDDAALQVCLRFIRVHLEPITQCDSHTQFCDLVTASKAGTAHTWRQCSYSHTHNILRASLQWVSTFHPTAVPIRTCINLVPKPFPWLQACMYVCVTL